MRLKIHEGTVKRMAKFTQGETMFACDALGNYFTAFKSGHHVVIEINEEEAP